jgi:polyphosphate kinase 2 (PPK2 family)
VLIVKVRPEFLRKQKLPPGLTGKPFWKQRYDDINMFERHLVRNGTKVLKFFLNVSKRQAKATVTQASRRPRKALEILLQRPLRTRQMEGVHGSLRRLLSETNSKWAP